MPRDAPLGDASLQAGSSQKVQEQQQEEDEDEEDSEDEDEDFQADESSDESEVRFLEVLVDAMERSGQAPSVIAIVALECRA